MKEILLLLLIVIMAGCASIIHGTHQNVAVNSVPSGAKIIKQGIHVGTTPAVIELKRGVSSVVLRFEKEGYEPIDVVVTNEVSGWVAGNIVFGGLIGLAIDFIDGAAYNLTPGELQAVLQKQGVAAKELPKDGVVIIDVQSLKK